MVLLKRRTLWSKCSSTEITSPGNSDPYGTRLNVIAGFNSEPSWTRPLRTDSSFGYLYVSSFKIFGPPVEHCARKKLWALEKKQSSGPDKTCRWDNEKLCFRKIVKLFYLFVIFWCFFVASKDSKWQLMTVHLKKRSFKVPKIWEKEIFIFKNFTENGAKKIT